MSDAKIAKFSSALPFWLSLTTVPFAIAGAVWGGVWIWALPIYGWVMFSILDGLVGLNPENPDPMTPDDDLYWYRLITLLWAPVQICLIFGLIAYVTATDHLTVFERIMVFFGVGIASGTVGINYSHELMHQQSKLERWLGDILLGSVLYSHFRSEHLLVHHRYVATPRDPVTARYNEGFHRFFPRVLVQCWRSAWNAEAAMLARKKLGPFHPSNPFMRYWALQIGFLALAFIVGGWLGVALFIWQAYIAIWQLELVNYVEHYGLTREHLGDGKYEHVKPHHSWNAAHKATNWLLINLQRHSDHHYKPDRRFPLLQTYDENDAPQLPFSYPLMTAAAMCPPIWKRIMNKRVKAWRAKFYPEIEDWHPYNKALNPKPR